MNTFSQILTYNFLGNSLKEYLIALGVLILAIIVLKIIKKVVIGKLKKVAEHTKTNLDNLIIKIIDSIGWPFYLILSLYLALQFIQLPDALEKGFGYLALIVVAYYIVKAVQVLIDYSFDKILKKKKEKEKKVDPSIIKLLNKITHGILWVIAVLIVLQNLGCEISALIAGLGIGGIAIAFALQSILGDVFACFSIYFDSPFKIGDYIVVGQDSGTVKKIGIKSTRIKTLQGQELILSNRELTNTRVHNYGKMEKRRIAFTFGVVYETPSEKLEKIPNIVKNIVDKIELADIDRVHFKSFGDFSLNFEVVYYVNVPDYNKYMDIQQAINLAIKKELEKEHIEFAYPTQTIFLNKS